MRLKIKVLFIIGLLLIVVGMFFFLVEPEEHMFNFITASIIGVIIIAVSLLLHSKDLKETNFDKSKRFKTIAWVWFYVAVFIIPIILVLIRLLILS